MTDQTNPRWFIDLGWYQWSHRSLWALVQGCLCPKCCKQLTSGGALVSDDDLIAAIRNCCSRTPGFIHPRLPILACIFRLFLANNNQPLELEELKKQLSAWCGGDSYRTSPEVLTRLLDDDQYYGLRRYPG